MILANIESIANKVKRIIDNTFPKESKKTTLEDVLIQIAKPKLDDNLYNKLLETLDLDSSVYSISITEADFVSLVNAKVKGFIDNPKVSSEANTFLKIC